MASLRPSSLLAFLSVARRTLTQHLNAPHSSQRLNLVVGNESADLDSITAAIIYAYFRSYADPKHPSHPTAPVHVPVLNIPREDVRIRPELLKLLPQAGIEADSLITLDDVFPRASSPADAGTRRLEPEDAQVTLVDHNNPTGPFVPLKSSVTGCIDHHVDESIVPSTASPRIITLEAGSCTSLVIQHVRPSWDALSLSASSSGAANAQDDMVSGVEDEAMRRGWDAQIAKLAMGSILIDTNDLKSKGKTRDVDREAVAYLTAKIELAPPGKLGGVFDRKTFFEDIKEAKGNLGELTVDEVLRKDYKEFVIGERKLGMSSVVKPLAWIAEKAGETSSGSDASLVECVKVFIERRKLDVYAIMTNAAHGPEKESRRELLMAASASAKGSLPGGWIKQLTPELKLDDIQAFSDAKDGIKVRSWRQHDLSKSRKQVAPLLRGLMAEALEH